MNQQLLAEIGRTQRLEILNTLKRTKGLSVNELLLAFVSTDYSTGPNTTVQSVAGAGLTWVLVVRTNAQSGTSEIWRTFAPSRLTSTSVTATLSQATVSSLTVMSFTGVDPSDSRRLFTNATRSETARPRL